MILLAVLISTSLVNSMVISHNSPTVTHVSCRPPEIDDEHPHPIVKPPNAKYMFEVEPEDPFEEDDYRFYEAIKNARKYDPLVDESYLQL